MLLNHLAAMLVLLASGSQASGLPKNPYAERDGAAEARADLASGRPLKLYAHVFDGRIQGYRSPGLARCNPGYTGQIFFAPLPEANWSEARVYAEPQMQLAKAARRFAAAYNQTIFKAREAEITRLCPNVRLAPED